MVLKVEKRRFIDNRYTGKVISFAKPLLIMALKIIRCSFQNKTMRIMFLVFKFAKVVDVQHVLRPILKFHRFKMHSVPITEAGVFGTRLHISP